MLKRYRHGRRFFIVTVAAGSLTVGLDAAKTAEPAAFQLAVREFTIAHTKPTVVPKDWRFVRRHETIRQHTMPCFEFAVALQKELGGAPLAAAGLIDPTKPDVPTLRDILQSDRFVIEPDEPNRPLLIYDAKGAKFGTDPPAIVLGTAQWVLPAALLTGLASLNVKHVHLIFGR